HAEWAALRERTVDRPAQHEQGRKGEQREDYRPWPASSGAHGHFTTILLAYSEPIVRFGSRWSAPSWLSRAERSAFIWSGPRTESLHCAGAPTSLTGLFSAKLKSTKNSRSNTSTVRSLAFTGALSGSAKCRVRTVSLGSNS